MRSVYGEQMATLLICFTATHSNQVFLKGLMLPALSYYKKKGVPSDHRLFDNISCQAFIPFWKCVAMTPKHFPFCVCCNYRSTRITEYERGKWKRGSFTRKTTCWGRGNTAPFFRIKSFFLLWAKGQHTLETSCYLLHTQWRLSAKQWVTEIDMLLQWLLHIHPSHQSHLGRLVLPGVPFLLVWIHSGCFSWIKTKTSTM